MKNVLLLALLLLAGQAGARGYSYSTWSYEMPDDAQESRQDGIWGYKAGNISYLFTPPAPVGTRTPEQVAADVIADVWGNQPRDVQLIKKDDDFGGARLLMYLVTTNTTAGFQLQLFQVFVRDGQWGLMLTTLPATKTKVEEQAMQKAGQVLASVEFNPPALSQKAALPASSALPSVPWPAPTANRVILNKAKIDFPSARKMGLDPSEALLPDTFDCYRVTSEQFPLRPMSPTPDARVTFRRDNTYSFNDGRTNQTGRWQYVKDGRSTTLKLDGPLSKDQTYVNGNDLGQKFTAYWNGKVTCLQQGPRADALRVEMARAKAGNETWNCVEQGQKPYTLKLENGTYSTVRGNGRLKSGFTLDDDNVKSSLSFGGGPFDSNDGQVSEDDFGNRELLVQHTVYSGSMFARKETTTLIARCSAKTTPKPQALYGVAAAPNTGQKNGPQGLFVGYRSYSTYMGGIPMTSYQLQLSYFTPNGYFVDDTDPNETGLLPDCTRTKPNGDPFCQRYEIKGKTIRTQDTDGEWNTPEALALTPDTLKMDDVTLYRVVPLKAPPVGLFSSDKRSASGMPGNAISGNISNFANAYQFGPDGRFAWRSDSSSSTSVGNFAGNAMIAGASSSRSDAGSGQYSLKDYWLTLTFSDGRIKRLFIYPRPAGLAKADSSMTQELKIGSSWLNRVGK